MGNVSKASSSKAGKRTVTEGVAHINAHFNNTVISISDRQGNTLCSAKFLH